jgi:hypothetical protein
MLLRLSVEEAAIQLEPRNGVLRIPHQFVTTLATLFSDPAIE